MGCSCLYTHGGGGAGISVSNQLRRIPKRGYMYMGCSLDKMWLRSEIHFLSETNNDLNLNEVNRYIEITSFN